jgi:NAD(P)-dependent dehydrogenase (short-subunit alcohol dehydrogenase family)
MKFTERGGVPVKNLQGKRALITGAASGIGREITLALASEGVDVWLVDIDALGLALIAAEIEQLGAVVMTSECDVSRPAEITRVVQALTAAWGGIDILVNNAGVAYYGPTENMSAEQWQWLLNINLLAPIQFTRELLPTLLSRPEAHLLNVCSISRSLTANTE